MGRFKEITIVPLSGDLFRGRVDVREVARDADVGYVLDGSLRRNGNALRVAARLVQGRTRAIELNANDIGVLFFGGVAHLKGGLLTEASALFERALALGTDMEGNSLAGLAHVAMCEGRLEDALDLGRRGVAGRSNLGWVHWPPIAAAALLGRLAEARQALATYRAHDPDGTLERIAFGQRSRDPSRSAALIEGLRLAGLE